MYPDATSSSVVELEVNFSRQLDEIDARIGDLRRRHEIMDDIYPTDPEVYGRGESLTPEQLRARRAERARQRRAITREIDELAERRREVQKKYSRLLQGNTGRQKLRLKQQAERQVQRGNEK